MTLEGKPQFDPAAIAGDISNVLTALAGVTQLGSAIEVSLTSSEPLQDLAEEVITRTRRLAKDTLDARAETVGVEDAAIEKAKEPIERLPLENADRSTVVGIVRDQKSGETIGAGKVVAKDPDGQVIGEGVVDATGSFAIELTGIVNEVHIEALDDAGKAVSVVTVELTVDEPAAHYVEMAASVRKKPKGEESMRDAPPVVTVGKEKGAKSLDVTRIRKAAAETHFKKTVG